MPPYPLTPFPLIFVYELNEDFSHFPYYFPIFFSMYEQETRRPSLVSALSTAYTVKSLPGAMLYIPLDSEYNTPVSLKRSLSDPEIYFPSPAVRHSLIVAVNGLFGGGGGSGGGRDSNNRHHHNINNNNNNNSNHRFNHGGGLGGSTAALGGSSGGICSANMEASSGATARYHHHHHHYHHHHRPHLLNNIANAGSSSNNIIINSSTAAGTGAARFTRLQVSGSAAAAGGGGEENSLQIDINVIQPTPNISPSASLRSMSGDSRDLADPPLEASYAGIPFLVVPPSPVKVRRVSFSEDDVSFAEDDEEDYDDDGFSCSVGVRTPMLVVTSSSATTGTAAAAVSGAAASSLSRHASSSSSAVVVTESETSRRRSRCKRQSSLQVRDRRRSEMKLNLVLS